MKTVDGFLYGSSMEPALAPNLPRHHSLSVAEKSIVFFLPGTTLHLCTESLEFRLLL